MRFSRDPLQPSEWVVCPRKLCATGEGGWDRESRLRCSSPRVMIYPESVNLLNEPLKEKVERPNEEGGEDEDELSQTKKPDEGSRDEVTNTSVPPRRKRRQQRQTVADGQRQQRFNYFCWAIKQKTQQLCSDWLTRTPPSNSKRRRRRRWRWNLRTRDWPSRGGGESSGANSSPREHRVVAQQRIIKTKVK